MLSGRSSRPIPTWGAAPRGYPDPVVDGLGHLVPFLHRSSTPWTGFLRTRRDFHRHAPVAPASPAGRGAVGPAQTMRATLLGGCDARSAQQRRPRPFDLTVHLKARPSAASLWTALRRSRQVTHQFRANGNRGVEPTENAHQSEPHPMVNSCSAGMFICSATAKSGLRGSLIRPNSERSHSGSR